MTNRISSSSVDITKENIDVMKELFPEVLTDGEKVDFDKLRTVLGDEIDDNHERYNFTWHGKKESILGAQKPSKGTLRPDVESSKNFDTTENLYIEGDNLEVLKLLQKSYNGKVKLIYIDPPYNTGKDFVYKDNFQDTIQSYLEQTGQVDDEGRKMYTNLESNGRFHTDWLNMIYPRLKLAKNLLLDDGVIVIHIDENELINLEKIMEEIFGEKNKLGTLIWNKLNPKGDSKAVAVQHEYIICYAKDKARFSESGGMSRKKPNALKILKKANELFSKLGSDYIPSELIKMVKKYDIPPELTSKFKSTYTLDVINAEFSNWIKIQDGLSGGEAAYSNIDEKGDVYQAVSMAWPNNKQAPNDYFMPLIHPITGKKCPVPEKGWRNPSSTMQRLLKSKEIVFGSTDNTQPRRKYLLKNNLMENVPSVIPFGGSDETVLKKLGVEFDNPKPYKLSMQIITAITESNDIILDFFSGSATTAHATMSINSEDGLDRKFIMVQLPEMIRGKSHSYKSNYRTICDIGQERIRSAGDKILKDTPKAVEHLDIGFRVLKLDKSNIREWNADFDELETTLENYADIFVPGRSELDIVYEIMLKNGLELTYPMTTFKVNGKNIYDIASGNLFICLDDDINQSIAQAIIEKREAHETETSTVVFKDSGFNGNDSEKLNCFELLKDAGYHEEHLFTI